MFYFGLIAAAPLEELAPVEVSPVFTLAAAASPLDTKVL